MSFWENDNNNEMSPHEIAQAVGQPIRQYVEEEVEEYSSPVEKTVSPALLRLEQGKLYQMLIEHDLFADVDAHPVAIQNVQQELKDFITMRLEVMLGMRNEGESVRYESPFTNAEVDALKSLAKKLIDPPVKKVEEPKSGNLTPVGEKAKSMLINKPVAVKPIQQVKKTVPVQKKPEVQKPKTQPKMIKKETQEMSLEERNALINDKKAVPESAVKAPMPSSDQMMNHYQMQQAGDLKTANLVQTILRAQQLSGGR